MFSSLAYPGNEMTGTKELTGLIADKYGDGGWRIENKYYISLKECGELRERLRAVMHKDPHSDDNWSYLISSVYFDTVDDRALREADGGLTVRKKYRIRAYNYSDELISVERKVKCGTLSCKTSFKTNRSVYDAIMRGDYEVLRSIDHPLARDFYYDLTSGGYRPKTIVEYDREVYVYPICDVRITFDRNIRGSVSGVDLFSEHVLGQTLPPYVVLLEVKYNHTLPDFIRSLLPTDVMQKISNCKYVLCREYM